MTDVDAAWAALDAKHDAEQNARHRKPWEPSPPPQRVHWPEGARWWHRLQGHHTRDQFGLITPPYAWQCLECDLTIGHY